MDTFLNVHVVSQSIILVMVAMAALGAIAFFLSIWGLIQPLSEISYTESAGLERNFNNYLITFTNVSVNIRDINFIRVAGYFNEPGAMAFYITQALLMNKLALNNLKIEISLIILGIFTFSLAFFISIFLYVILFYFNIHNMKKFVITTFIIILFFGALYAMRERNETLNVVAIYSLGRLLAADDERIIAGDNRSDIVKMSIPYFLNHPFLGYGRAKYKEMQLTGGSLFDSLVMDGLIGTFIFMLLALYFACRSFLKNYIKLSDPLPIKAVFVIFVNYFQRPEFKGVFSSIILIILIHLIKERELRFINLFSNTKNIYMKTLLR